MLTQPDRTNPFIPRQWVHRYHRMVLRRGSDGTERTIPCTAANYFLMDLNPLWYVDQLVRTNGNTLFILYLDTTNACTDHCAMCFTETTRRNEGFDKRLNVPLTLTRIDELRDRYPDTFKMVSLAGPGEPLVLPDIAELLEGISERGLATRVYTAGQRLPDANMRLALLSSCSLIRVSLDASSESTFREIHGVGGLKRRLDGLAQLVRERDALGGLPLIGVHFVIQKANYAEIVSFASVVRDLGVDFVVYGQETFGVVKGGFTEGLYNQVASDLETVEMMHDDTFATVVPRLVQRQTYVEFDKSYFASPAVLNKCHNSKHRIFFGVQNDFSACWLATLDTKFREQSYVGKLEDERTMESVHRIIDGGVGEILTKGAYLSCNSCIASNYNSMIDEILDHSAGGDIL